MLELLLNNTLTIEPIEGSNTEAFSKLRNIFKN